MGRITLLKISTLPNVIYRFNVIPIRVSMKFLSDKEKNDVKIHMQTYDIKAAIAILTKDKGIRTLDVKVCYRAIVIKTV